MILALFKSNRDPAQIVKLYRYGWEPLDAFADEARGALPALAGESGDPGDCEVVGSAEWCWLRWKPGNAAVIRPMDALPDDPARIGKSWHKVTMVRVWRRKALGRKRKNKSGR